MKDLMLRGRWVLGAQVDEEGIFVVNALPVDLTLAEAKAAAEWIGDLLSVVETRIVGELRAKRGV